MTDTMDFTGLGTPSGYAAGSVATQEEVVLSGTATSYAAGSFATQQDVTFNGTVSGYAGGAVGLLGGRAPELIPPPPDPDMPDQQPLWYVRLSDVTGTPGTQLNNVVVEEVKWSLNEPGSIRFSIPVLDSQASLCQPMSTEVQVWRNNGVSDKCLAVGVLYRPDGDQSVLNFQAPDPMDYLRYRFVGKADRENYLLNPQFEEGGGSLVHWDVVNLLAGYDPNHAREGNGSAGCLTNAEAPQAYLRQVVRMGPNGVGLNVYVVAYVRVDDGAWVGPAYQNLGLWVGRWNDITVDTAEQDFAGQQITWQTDRNVWVRLKVMVHIPPNVTNDLEVRLYCVQGHTAWDSTSMTIPESTAFFEDTYGTVVSTLVAEAQGNGPIPDPTKSNLHLACPVVVTGGKTSIAYQHVEHAQILDTITGYTELRPGVDVVFEHDPLDPTIRNIAVYSPYRGQVQGSQAALKAVFDPSTGAATTDSNISVFSYTYDGDQAPSSIVVLGEGDGPDREEGAFVDNTRHGGVTYEAVIPAPPDTAIDALDRTAAEHAAASSNPAVYEFTLVDRELVEWYINNVRPGDFVQLWLDWGYHQWNAQVRIIAMTLVPDDTVKVTTNFFYTA